METPRLSIRRFEPTDWSDLHEYLSLPTVLEFEPAGTSDEAECRAIALERSRGDSFWAVCLKDGGKMIGHVYFGRTEPDELETWAIGYIFNPAYCGRGYATDACRELLRHGFEQLGAHRVIAMCDPKNPPSWRLLERLSMRREGHFEKAAFFRRSENGEPQWHDVYQYGLLAEEWRAAKS